MKTKFALDKIAALLNVILRRRKHDHLTSTRRRGMVAVVMTCLFLLPAQWVQAQPFYVDPCAARNGNGSQEAPFNTLASAVDAAKAFPGSEIIMEGGVYPETITIKDALTLKAYNGSAQVGTGGYGVGWRDVVIGADSRLSSRARIYYPSCASGEGTPIASRGEVYPVVVYAHGRSSEGRELCEGWNTGPPSEDYTQLSGILNHLAASGIIAIAFDWYTPLHESGAIEGADIIDGLFQKAIDYLYGHVITPGTWLQGTVDLSRVGLMGHSTGGYHAYAMATRLINADVMAVGLIAPAFIWDQPFEQTVPLLAIHGTRESRRQVATGPLRIYCHAKAPKHLIVVEGANHFGYTDGICLHPTTPPAIITNTDYWGLLPHDGGQDNFSYVGGQTGHAAHALQQRTAARYLQVFFSYYFDKSPTKIMPDYLRQNTESEDCGLQMNDGLPCDTKELSVYMKWPDNTAETPCQSVEIELSDGYGVVNSLSVDQSESLNGGWKNLGTYQFNLIARITIDPSKIDFSGGCSVIADAVKFVHSGTQTTRELIRDKYFETSKNGWNKSTNGSGFIGDDYLTSSVSTASVIIFQSEYSELWFSLDLDDTDCEPVRYFDDLTSLYVQVKVCSCTQ